MAVTSAAAASGAPPAAEDKSIARLIVTTSLGKALEWFDISCHAYSCHACFAIFISRAFFPAGDAAASPLLTFGTFGPSFLIRPIGGLLLGACADRRGRKASLLVSIAMMRPATMTRPGGFPAIGELAPRWYLTAAGLPSLWALLTVRLRAAEFSGVGIRP